MIHSFDLSSKLHKDRDEILRFCSGFEHIYLYGAGNISRLMINYLKEEGIKISGIIVSRKTRNEDNINGMPVEEFESHIFTETQGIIVAVGQKNRQEIIDKLDSRGMLSQVYVQMIFYPYKSFRNPGTTLLPSTVENGSKGYFSDYKDLDELGKVFGTDKATEGHGYLKKYEFFLKAYRDQEFVFLELGIFKGASLDLWGHYFKNAMIIGVDIDPACKIYEGKNKKVYIMDVSLEANLQSLKKLNPTVIVDDASHLWSHQIKALFLLFETLHSGGIYILEDLGTSFPSYRFSNYDDSIVSTYEICSAIAEVVTSGEALDIGKISARVALFKDEIENLARQVAMISLIQESWIFIKK